MTTKFLHYRHVGEDGVVNSRGGITVAYVAAEEGATSAIAKCGPRDNYNRKYGRAKAEGRLNSPRFAEHHRGWAAKDVVEFYDDLALDAGLTRY